MKNGPIPAPASPIKLLFLAANSHNNTSIGACKEWECLKESFARESLPLPIEAVSCFSVCPDTLLDAVTDVRPTILHFATHGEPDGRIALEPCGHEQVYLPLDRLRRILRALRPVKAVRLVCLNACFAAAAANVLIQEVDAVVGSPWAIPDQLAVLFARRFYFSLARGLPISSALELGLVEVEDYCERHREFDEYIRGIEVDGRGLTPRELIVVRRRPEVDLDALYLGRPS